MIMKNLQNKIKKTIITFLSPYISFLFIAVFIIGILFMGVEELWEEFTSTSGIEEINQSTSEFIWPVPGYSHISSYFGPRIHPITKKNSFHDGIDIPAPQDTKVFSPANGKVTKTKESKTLGKTVEIESGEYKFVYYHLNFISVQEGTLINKGGLVGGVGTTGTLSTGNHLHFTVYRKNKKIDPLEIINLNIGRS